MNMKNLIKIVSLLIAAIFLTAGCSTQPEASPLGSNEVPKKRQEALIPIAKKLVEDMAAGNWQEAFDTFDSNMQRAMPVDQLPAIWQRGAETAGNFGSVGEATAVMLKGYETIIVQCPSKKANLLVQVVFSKSNKVSGIWFNTAPHGAGQILPSFTNTSTPAPDASKMPDTIAEEPVTVGKGGDWPLPGSLTLPKDAKAPLAAVVLVQGSGALDRDETLPSNAGKPFRDIAWGLAERGIAVLRYDKRTFTYGPKIAQQANELTVQHEYIEDAVAAANLLRQDSRIDKTKIYLVAHSEGAMLAPRIDMSGGGFAGLALLAGSPRKLWELQYDQNMAVIQTLPEDKRPSYQAQVDALKADAEKLASMSAEEAKKTTIFTQPGYYYWEMQQYNAGDIARGINKPMLILQGDKDVQASPEKDFGGWKQALAGKANVTYKLYPGLTHFFSEDDGTFSIQKPLGTRPIAVSNAVISDIAAWIQYGKLQ